MFFYALSTNSAHHSVTAFSAVRASCPSALHAFIWLRIAPRIIQTFIESNNLEGKKIYLFCTSGSSSIDRSFSDLKSLYPKLHFIKAQRIKLDSAEADIEFLLAKKEFN